MVKPRSRVDTTSSYNSLSGKYPVAECMGKTPRSPESYCTTKKHRRLYISFWECRVYTIPAGNMNYSKTFIIVLDLDNTLLFSTDNSIHIRCHKAMRLLSKIRKANVKIVVWCAGSSEYTAEMVHYLEDEYKFQIDMTLSGEDCDYIERYQIAHGTQLHKKPGRYILQKLQLSPAWTYILILDDRIDNSLTGYDARLWITPFVPGTNVTTRMFENEMRDWGPGEIILVYSLKHALDVINMLYKRFMVLSD